MPPFRPHLILRTGYPGNGAHFRGLRQSGKLYIYIIQTGAKKEEHLGPSLDFQEIWLAFAPNEVDYVYLSVSSRSHLWGSVLSHLVRKKRLFSKSGQKHGLTR